MSPLEGTHSPIEHLSPEAQAEVCLERNRDRVAHLPEDGSAVTLEFVPGLELAPDDEASRSLIDLQRNKLMEGSHIATDVIAVESYDANSADKKKTIGQSMVYEMPVPDNDGVRTIFLSVNSGTRASTEVPGHLSLTASRENPRTLDERVKEEGRQRTVAGSNPVRRLIGKLRS